MVKINIRKYEKRNIYVFAGLQLVGKRIRGIWYKLEVPCNMCGECCKRTPKNWWLGRSDKGWCKYLESYENSKYICKADIPFGCVNGDYEGEEWCCIKWQQQ